MLVTCNSKSKHAMSYIILRELFPCDIAELIYEFMKVNAANVIKNRLYKHLKVDLKNIVHYDFV